MLGNTKGFGGDCGFLVFSSIDEHEQKCSCRTEPSPKMEKVYDYWRKIVPPSLSSLTTRPAQHSHFVFLYCRQLADLLLLLLSFLLALFVRGGHSMATRTKEAW